jgi:AraC-like DNA-binding protein
MMPSASVIKANDLEEYRASVRPGSVELTVPSRGRFVAQLTRIDLHHLWMQRGKESLPRIWHAEPSAARTIVSFLTDPKCLSIRNGREVRWDRIALHSHHQSYWHRTAGPTAWGAMSLPKSIMQETAATVLGADLGDIDTEQLIAPAPGITNQLQRLHASIALVAVRTPEIIAHPAACRGLEQALVHALMRCLAGHRMVQRDTPYQRRRKSVVDRFHAALEANPDRAVFVPEVCSMIRVPDRTLRLCCEEYLGVSPKQYLLLRRLHLARRALRRPDRPTVTVTGTATSLGFWELGQFAVAYKKLFDESPSLTLRRALGRI